MNRKIAFKTVAKSTKGRVNSTKNKTFKDEMNVMFKELNGGAGLNPKLKAKFVIPKTTAKDEKSATESPEPSSLIQSFNDKRSEKEQPNGYGDRESTEHAFVKHFHSNGMASDIHGKTYRSRRKSKKNQRQRSNFKRCNRKDSVQNVHAFESESHYNMRINYNFKETVNQRVEHSQTQNDIQEQLQRKEFQQKQHAQQQQKEEFQQRQQEPIMLLPQILLNIPQLIQNQLPLPVLLLNPNTNLSNSLSQPLRFMKLVKLPNGQWLDAGLNAVSDNLNATNLLFNLTNANLLWQLNANNSLRADFALSDSALNTVSTFMLNNNINNTLELVNTSLKSTFPNGLTSNAHQQHVNDGKSLNSILAGLNQNCNMFDLIANKTTIAREFNQMLH